MTNQRVVSEEVKDRVHDAALELLSASFAKQNQRLSRLVNANWNTFNDSLNRIDEGEAAGLRIQIITRDIIRKVIRRCQKKGLLSPHYQASRQKMTEIEKEVGRIMVTYDPRLSEAQNTPFFDELESELTIEVVDAMLKIIGLHITDDRGRLAPEK